MTVDTAGLCAPGVSWIFFECRSCTHHTALKEMLCAHACRCVFAVIKNIEMHFQSDILMYQLHYITHCYCSLQLHFLNFLQKWGQTCWNSVLRRRATDYISQCQFVQPVKLFASSYAQRLNTMLQMDNVLLNTKLVAASPFNGFPEFGSEFACF